MDRSVEPATDHSEKNCYLAELVAEDEPIGARNNASAANLDDS
jgi:hypothetical protein